MPSGVLRYYKKKKDWEPKRGQGTCDSKTLSQESINSRSKQVDFGVVKERLDDWRELVVKQVGAEIDERYDLDLGNDDYVHACAERERRALEHMSQKDMVALKNVATHICTEPHKHDDTNIGNTGACCQKTSGTQLLEVATDNFDKDLEGNEPRSDTFDLTLSTGKGKPQLEPTTFEMVLNDELLSPLGVRFLEFDPGQPSGLMLCDLMTKLDRKGCCRCVAPLSVLQNLYMSRAFPFVHVAKTIRPRIVGIVLAEDIDPDILSTTRTRSRFFNQLYRCKVPLSRAQHAQTYTLNAGEDKIELSDKNLGPTDINLIYAWLASDAGAAVTSINCLANNFGEEGLAMLLEAIKGTSVRSLSGLVEGQTVADFSGQNLKPIDMKILAAEFEFRGVIAAVADLNISEAIICFRPLFDAQWTRGGCGPRILGGPIITVQH